MLTEIVTPETMPKNNRKMAKGQRIYYEVLGIGDWVLGIGYWVLRKLFPSPQSLVPTP